MTPKKIHCAALVNRRHVFQYACVAEFGHEDPEVDFAIMDLELPAVVGAETFDAREFLCVEFDKLVDQPREFLDRLRSTESHLFVRQQKELARELSSGDDFESESFRENNDLVVVNYVTSPDDGFCRRFGAALDAVDLSKV